jgi:hypothetical protein
MPRKFGTGAVVFELLKKRAIVNLRNGIEYEVIDLQELGLNMHQEMDMAVAYLHCDLNLIYHPWCGLFRACPAYPNLMPEILTPNKRYASDLARLDFSFRYSNDILLRFVYCSLVQQNGYRELVFDPIAMKSYREYVFCIDIAKFINSNCAAIKEILGHVLGVADLSSIIISYIYTDVVIEFAKNRRISP